MMAMAATKVETVVIGAGVVGLAVARALSNAGKEVLVLDRASNIGAETSSRNSEVIHGGLYYPQDSHKARFCVEGRHLMYDYCKSRGVFTNRCGKLIVATDDNQMNNIIPVLLEKAKKNGVHDVRLISAADAEAMEPNVRCKGAMYSPSTGIVDSHHFMLSLLADAESNSATLALHTSVDDANLEEPSHLSHDENQIQLYAGGMWLSCANVINCAGLWANHIAELLHRNSAWKPPPIYFAKGTYFRLQGQKSPFSRLIYPVPVKGGLGVHATIDAAGQVKFGPDVEWLDPKRISHADKIDMTPDPERAKSFYDAIRTYWPDLKDDSLSPDYTGVRPKLSHPSLFGNDEVMPFEDFSIVGPETHGVKGLVHLFGIESPGLTSSMAIADYVSDLLQRSQG